MLQSNVQTQIANPSSQDFQQRVRAAVAASLIPAVDAITDVMVAAISARVLQVTIIGFAGATPVAHVTEASTARFLHDVELRLGLSVTMDVAPAVAMRVTPVPSPPPTAPPMPNPPVAASSATESLGASTGGTTSGTLHEQVVWGLIALVLLLVLVSGCLLAYCFGTRLGRKTNTVQIGRPALRRQVSPEEQQQRHLASARTPESPQGDTAVVRVDDVRMLELGMAVQRAQSSSAVATAVTKLDGVQAAIDEVRESLSPRAEPHSPKVVETRIRASASLDSKI